MGWKATLFAAVVAVIVAVLYIQARTNSNEVGSLVFMGVLGIAGGYYAGVLRGMDYESAKQERHRNES